MERNSYGILKLTYLFSGAHLKIAGMNLQTHSNERGNENMKKKVKQNYEQMARQTGLRLDEAGGALYGKRGEYSVLVYPANPSYPYILAVSVSAARDSGPLTGEEIKQFKKDNDPVTGLGQNGYVVTMSLKGSKNQEVVRENLLNGLNALTVFLRQHGYQSCCQTCGRDVRIAPRYVSGSYALMCQECYAQLQQNKTLVQAQKKQKSENVIGGIVGALLGSLVGVACIILVSQLGYVAALSGIVMAVCTLKGYELLGGKLSKKGIAISAILMLVMAYVGDRADWAIVVARELEADFITAFQSIPVLLEQQIIDESSYWGNVVLLYFFLLVGAVPTIINMLKNQKKSGQTYSLDAEI